MSAAAAHRPPARGLLATLPVPLALALILALTLSSVVSGLARTEPASPWEAGMMLDGVRSMQGLPVYEPAESGHATNMYGPLMPHLLGLAYRAVGVHAWVGRALNLLALLFVSALVGGALGGPTRWGRVMASVLVLGAHNKAMELGIATRPDMLSHALGIAGLFLLYRGQRRRRIATYVAGIACLVLGMLFKQTAAVLAFVPLLALATRHDLALRTRLACGLAPPAAVLATLGVITGFFPDVHHYMVWLPAQYALQWGALPFYFFGMLASCSLFLWAFLDRLTRAGGEDPSERERWLLAALGVTLPASALFVAKVGGSANSIYLALVAMLAWCVHRLPSVCPRVLGLAPLRRFAACLALGVLMVASTVPVHPIYLLSMYMEPPPAPAPPFAGRYAPDPVGDDYLATIAFVRSLPGRAVSFDEPTITWFAKGQLDRTMALELCNVPEGGAYPRRVPDYVAKDLAEADHVVSYRTLTPYLQTAELGLGVQRDFRRLRSFGPFHVWTRRQP